MLQLILYFTPVEIQYPTFHVFNSKLKLKGQMGIAFSNKKVIRNKFVPPFVFYFTANKGEFRTLHKIR